MTCWRICLDKLKELPDSNQITAKYCNRFSGIFMCDGKYFKIKGWNRKYCLLWIVDYLKHDIVAYTLAPVENYQSWARLFSLVRVQNNYPKVLVCDGLSSIQQAAELAFPKVKIQLCIKHYLSNIKQALKDYVEKELKNSKQAKEFFLSVRKILTIKRTEEDFNRRMYSLFDKYRDDIVFKGILLQIERDKEKLTGYRGIKYTPLTTNFIEGLNSHLQTRLTKIKSFNSLLYARLWINGYILKRRLTIWTDCKGRFKKFNGKIPLDQTKKRGVVIPSYF